ncbi:hypothetical protein [Streptomyces venezuelae]|uniref:hypothetical protein n=1 Tax=Streptomyces venezuelae TaxID=54571 RepID=UPI003438F900
MTSPTITVAVWNLTSTYLGATRDYDAVSDIVASYAPDAYLQQHNTASLQPTRRMAGRLGMQEHLPFPNPVPDADIATTLYLNHTFTDAVFQAHSAPWWIHPCHVMVRVGDCPTPLNLLSLHLCPFDAAQRSSEAAWLSTLALPGMVTLAAGGMASYPRGPEKHTPPSWERESERARAIQRTWVGVDGQRRGDTGPDAALKDAGYLDLAQHAAEDLHQPHALTPTEGHRQTCQACRCGLQRTDRVYGVGGIHQALTAVEVIDSNAVLDAGGHALLLVKLNLRALEKVLVETTVPPW